MTSDCYLQTKGDDLINAAKVPQGPTRSHEVPRGPDDARQGPPMVPPQGPAMTPTRPPKMSDRLLPRKVPQGPTRATVIGRQWNAVLLRRLTR